MRKRLALMAAALGLITVIPAPASAATETYGDYSLMFGRTAGQYWAGGQVGGQWAWNPQSATTSDISWGDPAQWPPASAEHFLRSGDWVELDYYSGGAGKPVTEVQRVTSETLGTASCTGMTVVPSDGGRQHYAKWTIPAAGYCLDATGTITSTVNGSVVHFRHRQVWGAPTGCSNAYFSGQRCITQHEQWWDDNAHAYGLQIDRTQYIAKGKGMAFAIRTTVPVTWNADGRYFWTWS
ncbi:hypothetical protein [Fodinicola feengrottensis]|uniref:hypothetical protein n=1 Tax=Fodinicola feengrottensis TaxID=435914 RepID=UPI0013D1DD37|nr:hypothetical protein [Fodinicola feengrottensis]